jgi:hypothetical protein
MRLMVASHGVAACVPVPTTTSHGDVCRYGTSAVCAAAAVGVSAARTQGLPCPTPLCVGMPLLPHTSASLAWMLVCVDHSPRASL